MVKIKVCELLGYPVPITFRRTQPRFPGQDFDTYVQKADNLQIWNEEISPQRRYVVIRVNSDQAVSAVRVITGEELALLDTTGTLTIKHQAKSRRPVTGSHLVAAHDTDHIQAWLLRQRDKRRNKRDSARFKLDATSFLTIHGLFARLNSLLGTVLKDPGSDQERNRGTELHRAICERVLGLKYQDKGQFPDVPEQLLEVKLQTATTIDLGLVCPDSTEELADWKDFRHCDVRYAVFYGKSVKRGVRLDSVVVSTGERFFDFFQRFEGKVQNRKLQIPLPSGFFDPR